MLRQSAYGETKGKKISSAKYHGDYIFAFDDLKERGLIEGKLKIWRSATKREHDYMFYAHGPTSASTRSRSCSCVGACPKLDLGDIVCGGRSLDNRISRGRARRWPSSAVGASAIATPLLAANARGQRRVLSCQIRVRQGMRRMQSACTRRSWLEGQCSPRVPAKKDDRRPDLRGAVAAAVG